LKKRENEEKNMIIMKRMEGIQLSKKEKVVRRLTYIIPVIKIIK